MDEHDRITITAPCLGGPRDGDAVPMRLEPGEDAGYFPRLVGFRSKGKRHIYEIDVTEEPYTDSNGEVQFTSVCKYHYIRTEKNDD